MSRLPATRAAMIATLAGVAFACALTWGVVAGGSSRFALVTTLASVVMLLISRLCRPGALRSAVVLAALLLVIAAAGLLRGAGAVTDNRGPLATHIDQGSVVLTGTVREAPTRYRNESLVVVDVDDVTTGAGPAHGAGAIVAPVLGAVSVLPGDHVRIEASSLRRAGARPGLESAATLDREGVEAIAVSPRLTLTSTGGQSPSRWIALARAHLSAAVAGALPEPVATLVDEFALGVRGTLPSNISTPLQDAGLIHLVATSGLKVALVIALLVRLLALAAASPRVRLSVILATVTMYVAISGGGPPAVRAAVMAAVGLMVASAGRRVEPFALLTVVGALMLAFSPRLCTDVGFQLSFLGTAGILLFAEPIARRLPGPRLFAEPVAVTIAAQMATFPVMASTFGVISLVAPFANGLAVPALPPLLALGWAGAALAQLHPALGWLPLQLAGAIASGILVVARIAAALPLAAVHPGVWPHSWTLAEVAAVIIGAGMFGLLRWQTLIDAQAPSGPRPRRAAHRQAGRATTVAAVALSAAVAGAGVLLVSARPDGHLHVSVLSVGAAPAVLVKTPDGGLALVDGGSDPSQLGRALGESLAPTVRTIDVLILTGGERAAVAGLKGLEPHYGVSRAIVPPSDLSATAATFLSDLRTRGAAVAVAGGPWSWGGASWRFVCAAPATSAQGALLPTCALQVAATDGSVLILGDVATAEQEEIAATGGSGLAADLVVTPPAGLLAPALLDAVHPRHVAIPSARSLGRAAAAIEGTVVRATAGDGTLDYAGSSSGLMPA